MQIVVGLRPDTGSSLFSLPFRYIIADGGENGHGALKLAETVCIAGAESGRLQFGSYRHFPLITLDSRNGLQSNCKKAMQDLVQFGNKDLPVKERKDPVPEKLAREPEKPTIEEDEEFLFFDGLKLEKRGPLH